MDSDLVERLRGAPVDGYGALVALLDEAADRIEALEDYITSIRGTVVKGEPIGTIKALRERVKVLEDACQEYLDAFDNATGTVYVEPIIRAALQETGQ
ncbi:hypothetical protein UFOVP749_43 [uncultured Caudovirales phage]|uniref:Uncharacterized protein n=1 Tax=uncultured Caudovirales phage TaxID=2100421 RepID=A0A6J7X3N9_9CAUD|nr:hypothetical protein UFOVP749_43 [uncultured Caudovirales phage]